MKEMSIDEMRAYVAATYMHPQLSGICEVAIGGEFDMQEEEVDVFRIILGLKPISDSMKGVTIETLFNVNAKRDAKAYWDQVRRDEYFE